MEITELLSAEFIRGRIADSDVIFQRGMRIFNNGGYYCMEFDPDAGYFEYEVDGNYGDYDISDEADLQKTRDRADRNAAGEQAGGRVFHHPVPGSETAVAVMAVCS